MPLIDDCKYFNADLATNTYLKLCSFADKFGCKNNTDTLNAVFKRPIQICDYL